MMEIVHDATAATQAADNAPRELKRVTVKEELIALTGDFIDAAVLNHLIKCQAQSRQIEKFIEEERARLQAVGQELAIAPTRGWFYKKAAELSDETMIGLSESNTRARLKKLIDRGWVLERSNPYIKWDKTKQYRVDIQKISADLEPLGYALDGWLIARISETKERTSKTEDRTFETEVRESETELRSARNERAIPSRTTSRTQQDVNNKQQQAATAPLEASPVVAVACAPSNGLSPEDEALADALCQAGYKPRSAAREAVASNAGLARAWLREVQGSGGLKNPGGYLRKRIASGEWPASTPEPESPKAKRISPAQKREKHAAVYESIWSSLAEKLRADVEREGHDKYEYIEKHHYVELNDRIRQSGKHSAENPANRQSG